MHSSFNFEFPSSSFCEDGKQLDCIEALINDEELFFNGKGGDTGILVDLKL